MELDESIDIIIVQEQKEIKSYNVFAIAVVGIFFGLLIFNLISGYIKDIALASTNFLTLAVGYIPLQQIIKRKKRIIYFKTIVRPGISKDNPNKSTFDAIVLDVIRDTFKN
jgi:hypothetical protein